MLDVSAERRTFVVSEPDQPAYVRSPVTAIRLLVSLVVVGFMYVALQGAAEAQLNRSHPGLPASGVTG